MRSKTRFHIATVAAAACLLAAAPALADGGAAHQVELARPIALGVSGGSIDDLDGGFCCGGTLGGLVQDGSGNLYVLSNNHVLGRTNRAQAGEDTVQPGLIDSRCRSSAAKAVADFTALIPISFDSANLVDAAIARVRPGAVDPRGAVLDIGTPSSSIAQPAVGMSVQKSGRTTGRTTGRVVDVGATVLVAYGKKCGAGGGPAAVMDDQFLISDGSFSDSGDSGSVIFESGSNPRAVGLLFAGSSSYTIANRISNVLAAAWPVGPLVMAGGTVAGCASNGDCVDADPCTVDVCQANGACAHSPLACDDGNACTADACVAGACTSTAISCDDGNACTADGCNTASGCYSDPIQGCVDPCGDGVCDASGGEDCRSCPGDCNGKTNGKPSGRFCCGAETGCSDPRCTSGAACVSSGSSPDGGGRQPPGLEAALAAKKRASSRLLAIGGVVGHGVTTTRAGDAVITVYLASDDDAVRARVPTKIEGIAVRTRVTGRFEAY